VPGITANRHSGSDWLEAISDLGDAWTVQDGYDRYDLALRTTSPPEPASESAEDWLHEHPLVQGYDGTAPVELASRSGWFLAEQRAIRNLPSCRTRVWHRRT